jgi:LDH2 family malate/lactate/ureidoglycolate dehydrogenase
VNSRVPLNVLRTFATDCFQATGLNSTDSSIAAETLTGTDLLGVFTHGTKLLAGYLRKLQGGGYRTAAIPRVEREGPAWAVIDGDSGLGQVGCHNAMLTAIQKAQACGVAFVSIRNTGHIGAAGQYALLATRHGCAAMITGNDIPSVAAPGSRTAVLGSNPLAFAIPTDSNPILLDIATAAVAGGKVYAAWQRGETIPPTWLIGPDGLPTTDGSLYPHSAALAPMAGHKGYGLGLWCEVLSGLIPGGHMTWQVGSWMFDPVDRPSWHNASMTVINIDAMTDRQQFNSRIRTLIDEIHAAPPAAGATGVLLPGEREFDIAREAAKLGIDLPADVRAKLQEAAKLVSIPLPAEV